MSGGFASSGFEVGNVLARGTYPAARLKRPGAPPSSGTSGQDLTSPRGSPIRSRPTAFGLRAFGARSVIALPGFVGPGLIKRLDLSFQVTPNGNPQPFFNLFHDTTPYVTATGLAVTAVPHGTPVFSAEIADDQPTTFADEGGLGGSGITVSHGTYLVDFAVSDPQFFLALTIRNNVGAAYSVYGSVLVYEGVLISDYPFILG